ncbi:MAG: hypothetical protein JSR51_05355 [Proteobacteria bacterium]|nr:hypothetical protein [Pseudomonadota bacterium]
MTDLTTAKATVEELRAQGGTLSEKLTAAQNEQNSLAQQHDNASTTLETTERAHILDQVSDDVLLAAQQARSNLATQLAAVNRRITLIREAIAENDLKIAAAAQSLKIARSEFCISRRNAIFNEIQNDQKLKAKLLEALAAFALNGHIPYTTDRAKFFEMFARNFLPEFAEAEVTQAAEKFRRDNQLD